MLIGRSSTNPWVVPARRGTATSRIESSPNAIVL
jgi:hypothetical protein